MFLYIAVLFLDSIHDQILYVHEITEQQFFFAHFVMHFSLNVAG